MTSKLTPFEQMVYDSYHKGMTDGGIAVKYRRPMPDVLDARNQILKKGYKLPKKAIPESELPRDAEDVKEEMEMMRNTSPITEEEKQEIIEYRKTHTINDTMIKFRRGQKTICDICKAAEEPEPVQEADAVPAIVLAAVKDKIEALRNYIVNADYDLVKAKADLAELIQWDKEHGGEV